MDKKDKKSSRVGSQAYTSEAENNQRDLYRSYDEFISKRYDALSADYGLAEPSAEQEVKLPYVIELTR